MSSKKADFNKLRSELDEILNQLQDSSVDVDAALKLYERGQAVIKELEDYLKSAENKIKKLNPPKES